MCGRVNGDNGGGSGGRRARGAMNVGRIGEMDLLKRVIRNVSKIPSVYYEAKVGRFVGS